MQSLGQPLTLAEHLLYFAAPMDGCRPVVDGGGGIGRVAEVLAQDAAIAPRFHELPSVRVTQPVRARAAEALGRLHVTPLFD